MREWLCQWLFLIPVKHVVWWILFLQQIFWPGEKFAVFRVKNYIMGQRKLIFFSIFPSKFLKEPPCKRLLPLANAFLMYSNSVTKRKVLNTNYLSLHKYLLTSCWLQWRKILFLFTFSNSNTFTYQPKPASRNMLPRKVK